MSARTIIFFTPIYFNNYFFTFTPLWLYPRTEDSTEKLYSILFSVFICCCVSHKVLGSRLAIMAVINSIIEYSIEKRPSFNNNNASVQMYSRNRGSNS